MAIINETGVVPTTLTEYVTLLQQKFISIFGSLLKLDPETPQGQIIGELSLSFEELDEAIVDCVNASNIFKAIGQQLDALTAALGITRRSATATEVDVQLTGVPATFIPAGTKAKDSNGNQFALEVGVTLSGGGTGTGTMKALQTGPIVVNPNTLTQVVDVVPGWETINNSAAGETGQNEELDPAYLSRYEQSVRINSVTPVGSVKAALLALSTVQQAEVVENDESSNITVQGLVIPPKSLSAIVIGGTDQEVGTAIGQKKTTGCATNGTSSYVYTDPSTPVPKTIYFYRATAVPVKISLNITLEPRFPSGGDAMIKANLLAYFAKFTIGQDVVYTRLFTPINLVPGFEINSFQIGKVSGAFGTTDIPIVLTEIATLDISNIDIVVT